jgi:DNA-binding MarR family transcriptional regulator
MVESHLLIELATTPALGVGELSEVLQLAQGFVSRVVHSLSKRKLLVIKPGDTDSRRRKLVLTPAGHALVSTTDEIANARYYSMIKGVSGADEQRIIWLFKTLADGMGSPSSAHRVGEPVYRIEQRRLSRACGLVSESVFGTGISDTMWQVLGEVVLSPIPPRPGELADLLSIASNSLSSLVSQMVGKGYLRKVARRSDARCIALHPLPAGRALYQEIEATAAKQIEDALRGESAEKVARAVQVFHRFAGDSAQGIPCLASHFLIEKVVSEQARKVARGFIARTLVRENLEDEIPEHLVSGKEECFLLREQGQIRAVLAGDTATGSITSVGWDESVSPWSLAAFIGSALLPAQADLAMLKRAICSCKLLREFE